MILPEQYEEGRGPYAEIASLKAENEKLRAALEYAIDVFKTIEMTYDDRRDEKLDLNDIKDLAGYAIESTKKALAKEGK